MNVNERFGGIHRLHFLVPRVSQVRSKHDAGIHTGLFLGLLFDPEDRGDMFLLNVG
jgi:hypothetical protein